MVCARTELRGDLSGAGRLARYIDVGRTAKRACRHPPGRGYAQAGLLAQKDSVTPCVLVGLQSAVNAVGSFALVAGLRLGLPGVAAATVAGQWLGAVLLLRALCATPVRPPAGRPAGLCLAVE